jgi:hypothetical protein
VKDLGGKVDPDPRLKMNLRETDNAIAVAALRKIGENVNTIYDLVNTNRAYAHAIPVLVDLLSKVNHPDVEEGVVRALAVKEAAGNNDVIGALVSQFRSISSDDRPKQLLKWAIANTLSVIARDEQWEEISGLCQEKHHGKALEMVVLALGNMRKNPRAVQVLIDLLGDDAYAGHATVALGKLKAVEAEESLERMLHHRKPWVREEAKRALRAIRKGKRAN